MRDDVMGLSAELAYRFFLAIFPFAIFLTALGGFVAGLLPIQNPAEQAVQMLGDALPEEAAAVVQSELEGIIQEQSTGLLSLGAVLALFFATGGTNAIIKAVNRVYSVAEGRPIWKRYLVAIAMTLLAGAALIGAIILIGPLRILAPEIANALGLGETAPLIITIATGILAFALLLAAAAWVYRVAPNIRLPLKSVFPGALLFAIAWIVGTLGFFIYVTNIGNYGSTYGALAGVVIVLIWFYVSALLFLLGAEFNEVFHEMRDPADVENRRQIAALEESGDKGRSDDERAAEAGRRRTAERSERRAEEEADEEGAAPA
ncbi:MAG TPA: YihY/virulence factor BrkB family protein [Candidatus Limnocylindria bacterium]|nr:YihY/virulence factor BrkB family protein [Candidatus Limnocylindria bacterium]